MLFGMAGLTQKHYMLAGEISQIDYRLTRGIRISSIMNGVNFYLFLGLLFHRH